MYENLLHQPVVSQLKRDIKNDSFPGAVLFSGPQSSGKLTCALETSRVLSCLHNPKASWNCNCPSCLRAKAMTSGNLILTGPRDCSPEIKASAQTFLKALKENASYLNATRYLFIRSIRKLTLRFNQVLWENDDKLSKIASITSDIDEELEILDYPHELPEFALVEKTVERLIKLTSELEDKFLYDSIPVNQIRNLSSWARMKSVEGKNTVIIENADRMLESVRNALLKILEEPPEDTVFILTTSRKNAVMPTILSRLRVYNFNERNLKEQQDVISQVFHNQDFTGNVEQYLQLCLPVSPDMLKEFARNFINEIIFQKVPNLSELIKNCGNFEPRIMFKIFLNEINFSLRSLMYRPDGVKALSEINKALFNCYNNVSVYNQGISASLECLVREIAKINKINGSVLKCAIM